MESKQIAKPHAVIVPFPLQGHVDPMLNLAKILHAKGFHITYVHTEYNYQRILKSRGSSSLDGLGDFRYATFPDGLPSPDIDRIKDLPSLVASIYQNGPRAVCDLIRNINTTDVPPITCIISDNTMDFTLDVGKELSVPVIFFWAASACALLGYLHLKDVVEKGLVPLKDESYLVNGYLETHLDWIPGMSNIRLKDMTSYVRTTDPDDLQLKFAISASSRCYSAASIIFNTFLDYEPSVLEALSSLLPPVYEIGPVDLLYNQMIQDKPSAIESMGSNHSKPDYKCFEWLDTKSPGSVIAIYVEYIYLMTNQQVADIAWGLCDSNKEFLWVISSEFVRGDTALLPEAFLEETKDRSVFVDWCSQKDVLNHQAIGGLLTNCYYELTFESVCAGVPMLCLPVFGEQMTNCRYLCTELGVALEIDSNVKRGEMSGLIMELMDGEKGKDMRRKAENLKTKAIAATQKGGSSFIKMEKLLNDIQTII